MTAKASPPLKLLVANRSEIACRVFQACRELGIRTVAISAPGDEQARHLTYADEVQPVKAYLDIEDVVQAAKRSGAALVHPGYGFLSERPAFARAVEAAAITFVGPRAETMELMGGKIAAKDFAEKHGVPTLPWAKVGGEDGAAPAAATLQRAAGKVGFPLLLKAAAGGGGKGMRRVDRVEDLESAAESAAAEAVAAFGDGTLFLERLVLKPRHIEVQVFGDGKGGGVHLRERECSLQRRHQKVWEEAPAPHLPEATREGLLAAAMKLVEATKYRNAGTCEFLVDDQGGFYFLEMNTRLQVEHPVSEHITGVDLVHAQILQALNPEEPYFTASPGARGWSIEVRIYAEDPSQGYMPTPGTVHRLKWPVGAGIRVDSGIEEGQLLGTSFDPMLAKLVVTAPDRRSAIERLKFALDETLILGLGTNLAWLRSLCDQPAVREGRVDTGWLEREFGGFGPVPSETERELISAMRAAGLTGGFSGMAASNVGSGEGRSAGIPSPWSVFAGGER